MNQVIKSVAAAGVFAAAIALPVQAAGNLTLYGLVDAGYQYQKIKGRDATSGLVSGGQAASRWGLRGSEGLGGGLKANFVLENGFDVANGTAGQRGRLFGRLAWLGLSDTWGDVRLGRQTLAANDYTGIFSPFGLGFKLAGSGSAINSNTTPRADSTVKYVSPRLAGAQLALSYSFNANLAQNTDGSGVAASNRSDRVLSTVASYQGRSWQLVGYYQATHLGRLTSSGGVHADVSPREYGLGGAANLGKVRLHAGFAQHKDAYINGVLSGNAGQAAVFKGGRVNGYVLGASAPLGAGQLLASVQFSDPDGSVQRAGQKAHSQTVYSVGYTHALSKRTNWYAYASYLDGAWFDDPASGVSAGDWNTTQVALGLRHSF